MKYMSHVGIVLALLAAVSCGPRETGLRPTIPYVDEILNGLRPDERSVIEASAMPQPSGSICVIGGLDACYGYADYFSGYDQRDNVSGAHSPDALPDFAGETIVCIADDKPFVPSVLSGDTLGVRREAVMRVLCAMDTLVHITPYDVDGFGGKTAAKLVVMADPCLAEYGMFDIDTLKSSLGNKVPVVSPLGLMLDAVFRSRPGETLNVGMVYDPRFAPDSIYIRQFRRAAASHGASGSQCVAFPAEGTDSLLHRLVENYAAAGNMRPLDAVLVDVPSVPSSVIKTELADMVSVMNASALTYGRMLSEDFRLIHGLDAVAEYCYDVLRRYNLFTHEIALPEVVLYRPVANPDSEDGEIILIPDLYVQN